MAAKATAAKATALSGPVDLHVNDPVHFIASQHQGTCFTDSIETILCYADTIRHVFLGEFLQWLTHDKLRTMTDTDPEFDRFVRFYVSSHMYNPSPSIVNYVKSMFMRYTLRQFQQQEEELMRTLGLPMNDLPYPTSSKTLKRRASIGPAANRIKHYASEILYKERPVTSCSTGSGRSRIPQIELLHVVQSLLHPYVMVEDILRVGLARTLNLFQSNKLLAIKILLVGSKKSRSRDQSVSKQWTLLLRRQRERHSRTDYSHGRAIDPERVGDPQYRELRDRIFVHMPRPHTLLRHTTEWSLHQRIAHRNSKSPCIIKILDDEDISRTEYGVLRARPCANLRGICGGRTRTIASVSRHNCPIQAKNPTTHQDRTKLNLFL